MSESVHILHLEDDRVASQFVEELLRRDGLRVDIQRVDTLASFEKGLRDSSPDLVLSDFTIPGMDAFEALELARKTRPDLPYVFFSGTLGEDAAVEALKRGATDYVIKDHPARLAWAIRNALKNSPAVIDHFESTMDSSETRGDTGMRPSGLVKHGMMEYAAAIVIVGVTWAVRAALDPFLGAVQPYALFFVPVLIMGALSGVGPACLATVLGWVIGDYFFCYPRHEFLIRGSQDLVAGLLYYAISAALITLTTYVRRARKQAEAASTALRNSQERWRLFVEHTPTLIWVKDEDGRYVFVNKAYERRFGVSQSMCRGKTDEQLWDPKTAARLQAADKGVLNANAPIELEEETTDPTGSTSYWHNTKFSFRETSGKRFVASIGVDITPRKRAAQELLRLKDELSHSNEILERTVQERTARLRESIHEMEAFSYTLVHDMRAPLRAMNAYASILETDAAAHLAPSELDLLRKLKIACSRMDQLITDSLNYSKIVRDELPIGPVNVGTILRDLIETYPNLQPPAADIRIDFQDFIVQGNEAALTQVFSNLLGNAVKFVAPGVKPRVRVWAQMVDATNAASRETSVKREKRGVIWLEDNGVGIPTEGRERLFGMFQRMHKMEEYPGTGIGLAIVKKSLDRIGGRIDFQSEPGKGTRFRVDLPMANV